MLDLLPDNSPITVKMKVSAMQAKQAFEITELQGWECQSWIDETGEDDDQDDSSLLTGALSPRDVYEIDEPLKLSMSAGSLW